MLVASNMYIKNCLRRKVLEIIVLNGLKTNLGTGIFSSVGKAFIKTKISNFEKHLEDKHGLQNQVLCHFLFQNEL